MVHPPKPPATRQPGAERRVASATPGNACRFPDRRERDRRAVEVGPPVVERRLRARRVTDANLKPICPDCGASTSTVFRTQGGVPKDDKYLRGRECSECGGRFWTNEIVDALETAIHRAREKP